MSSNATSDASAESQADTRPVILIANRGEIAVRIIAAAKRIGASPVLAASVIDADSPAARMADRVVVIGASPAGASYLRPEQVAQAAVNVGAVAVHPGYGFLSEQPHLAELLAEEGIAFVGPRPETLRAVGDKGSARKVAIAANVPVAAGVEIDDVDDIQALVSMGNGIGYPLLIKAIHGGGGRGIRLVENSEQLAVLVPQAAAEALGAFGNGALYLERYYGSARHVEVQVFGDGEGGVQIFGDRDCSVQRRHQKLIEECPAPGLTDARRKILHDASRALVIALKYRGAGTVEFLVDTLSDDVVFLEVNARIQVEHPVTEEAFGVDLVAAQLRLALGMDPELPDVPPVPPATVIELRLNAEDPNEDFRPNSGDITAVSWPRGPGIRVDTQIEAGYRFPPYYDSLMAKLIVRAHNRDAAVATIASAAANTRIDGIKTTLPMHHFVLAHPDFIRGQVPTSWFAPVWENRSNGVTS
jgi:acetyl-CoA carboxylase biotin carboxylase subunit